MRIIPEGSSKNEASATLHKSQKEHFFSCLIIKGSAIDQSALRRAPQSKATKRFCKKQHLLLSFFDCTPPGPSPPSFQWSTHSCSSNATCNWSPTCRLLLFLLEEGLPTHNFKPFYYCVLTVIRAHNSKYPEGIYAFCCP